MVKKYQNKIAKRHRQDGVTVSNSIARKINTQKNKTGTENRRYRDERAAIVTTARKTGTGHQRDRDKRATTVTTTLNGSTC